MHLAAKRYARALNAFVHSILASPTYFLQRLRDEFLPVGTIANGIAPELFYRRKEAFWP
jgi:hypothetical protein